MKDDGIHETWVELLIPERPWEILERPDSRPSDIPPFVMPTTMLTLAAEEIADEEEVAYVA